VREQYEAIANAALAEAGRSERIDRRTLAEQGIDREPINYSRAALDLGKRGVITPQAEEMERRKKRNRLRPARAAAGRALPVPHIEREEIREASAIDQEQTQTRETPRPDAWREIEREIIRAKYRRGKQETNKQEKPPARVFRPVTAKAKRPKGPRF